jgi:hypothetical protein
VQIIKYWLGIVKSVFASFMGIQTTHQYEKDTNMPSFVPFLVVGVFMLIALLLSIALIVSLIFSYH